MPNFKLEAKVQLWIFLGPAVVGFVVALILPGKDPLALLTIAIAMTGAWQILKSKLSLKSRTHVAKEWGSKNMSDRERLRYRLGYLGLISAIALTIWQRLP